MLIPVFVSCPTTLSEEQQSSRELILKELKRLRLEPRALGRSDYPTEYPLREVYVIAKHCSGGVVLGFDQFQTSSGISKPGTDKETIISSLVKFPTPWNNLEAGILFGLKIPLLVFKEDGVSGGVFDNGVTDAFVHVMPGNSMNRTEKRGLSDVFLKWQAKVREHYYQ